MPTYELKCGDCGTEFERFLQRILRDEDKVCVSCGSGRVTTGLGGGILGAGTSGGDSRVDTSCAPGAFS